MLPGFTATEIADCRLMHAIAFCYFFILQPLGAQVKRLYRLFFCQFGIVAIFTRRQASFALCIVYVVSRCANKQVVWPNTWWIVAMVAYVHAFRYRLLVQFIRIAMSEDIAAFLSAVHQAVTVFIQRANPQPTVIGFLDASPKGFWRQNAGFAMSIVASSATEFALAMLHLARGNKESGVTVLTNARKGFLSCHQVLQSKNALPGTVSCDREPAQQGAISYSTVSSSLSQLHYTTKGAIWAF